ncbi:MAG TPA: type ISP restriction/modification enzyme [Thermoanaerobaculia bacterium]|nr:type ISP restriction/modification enzyme [Thermoanaerobaculia bacterium]
MSQLLIQQYLNQLQDLRKVSGTHRESVVREAFKDLLKGWARQHDLVFVPEYEFTAPTKERRYVDGALLHALRVPFGYWEAKDEKDDLDSEIALKLRRGYPQDNIIFEDSTQAVLMQNRIEVMRCPVDDVEQLERLLHLFFSYARPEVAQFRKAVEQFKADLPAVLEELRVMIEKAHSTKAELRRAAAAFLLHAQETINPSLTAADVREMLIQHILTEEIFVSVFPNTPFHQDNNVARELYKLEATFFTGNTKFQTLKGLAPYYVSIRAAATQIASHHEKQKFLKVIYEGFYRVYNPKAADRLGVVYTPNEIVRFIIESADWLCEKHFSRNLIDKDVEILDPATGTGTFVCELLEHFRGQSTKLKYKYRAELHANEVAILPYYVANLNIEATYAAITGEYEEFPNLCFMDTLDNVGLHTAAFGTQGKLFGSVTEENVARIRRQNSRTISVILGNPPYNANQLNENENNKNREYDEIDKRIKATYIAESTAQKTKLYDMYARFFRWASDRLAANGVLAFVTNRSFIDSRTYDGFRKVVAEEFSEIRVVDLGGDVRANQKLSGTKNNVFGIQTGVAISFLVKRAKRQGCRIFYTRRPELETAEEKLAFLGSAKIGLLPFEEVRPDAKHNWINQTSNDFETLLPIATKAAKATRKASQERAIFKMFSLGVVTNRDEWVYEDRADLLEAKVRYLIAAYNADSAKLDKLRSSGRLADFLDTSIKWTRAVKNDLRKGVRYNFDRKCMVRALYRPYVKRWLYFSRQLNEMLYQTPLIFGNGNVRNRCIVLTDPTAQKPWMTCALDHLPDLHFVGAAAGTVCLALEILDDESRFRENITDWALDRFKKNYQPGRGRKSRPITKGAIFHYVYGVLHDPVYRDKYAQNLKREFPRIPFYPDFWKWAEWGEVLMGLHIGFETLNPWPLGRTDVRDKQARKAGLPPKVILKADKENGRITLDSETVLAGVPPEAWEYRLGNRSALEWILDQYKEKKPKDPTIRAHFDTYRFADYKAEVIDLLARVTTVSVETVRITRDMLDAGQR